ncbi:MAG: tRNA (adenosine(37)-N6)-dimethylallyltransferase MiaA [Candidatus Saccharimonadales bacterium]
MATDKLSPLLVIVGETASGKSSLALDLAASFNGEIICADSWTVRREVNVGTAKPSAADQKKIPHHLIDVVGPDEDFTAALYKRLADQSIKDISSRGKLPILVGGTGLYIDSLIYDYNFLPPGSKSERQYLNSRTIDELLNQIESLRLSLGEIDTNNKRRLIRLIETNGAIPTKKKMRANTLIIGIKPDPNKRQQQITQRLEDMINNGLEAEVMRLSQQYGWDCEALKGIGYAQWQGYLKGSQTMQQTKESIIKATLDLAKRQRTWFKRNKSIQWIYTPVNRAIVVDTVTTFLTK